MFSSAGEIECIAYGVKCIYVFCHHTIDKYNRSTCYYRLYLRSYVGTTNSIYCIVIAYKHTREFHTREKKQRKAEKKVKSVIL